MQNRLEGYEYCLKHILEDKNAPFKQCSYTSSKSGKRCTNACPKSEKKDGYCLEHSRQVILIKQRTARKKRPKESPETLLEGLDNYTCFGREQQLTDGPDNRRNSVASKALEYASSSDSDAERPVVDQTWRGDCDSDAESIDSEQEDLLKHAGIYTAEEVALIMRDKLIRLQSLYIDQFKRLQHVMKEKRRKYIHTVRQEKEMFGGVGQYAKDQESQENWARYTAMKRYHRRYGVEALLHRQSKERRIAASEGANYKPPAHPKCTYSHTGEKCPNRSLPLSKFCLQHILNDTHQVLYRPCCFGDRDCGTPVATCQDMPFCDLHTRMMPIVNDIQMESKADTSLTEDIIDVTNDITTDPALPTSSGNMLVMDPAQHGSIQVTEPDAEEVLIKKGKLLFQHLKSVNTNGTTSDT